MLIKSLVFKKLRERKIRLFLSVALHTFGVSKLFGVIVLYSPSCSGTGVFGDSKFASESIVVSGVSWLVFPFPNIQGTWSLMSASKNDGRVIWGVVVALGSLSGVVGNFCAEKLAGHVGDNWIPQRLAKLSRACWASSWFSNSGTQSQPYLKRSCSVSSGKAAMFLWCQFLWWQ